MHIWESRLNFAHRNTDGEPPTFAGSFYDIFNIYIFNPLIIILMFTILKNGKIFENGETKTFGNVLNENAVGKTFLVEANGKKFKVLKYWKSQKTFADKPEQTTKGEPTGNKTTFVVKWTGEKEETYTNDSFRKQFCPEYSTKTYERDKDKAKEFKPAQNLNLASLAELAELEAAIKAERERREAEKEARKAALLAELAALDK